MYLEYFPEKGVERDGYAVLVFVLGLFASFLFGLGASVKLLTGRVEKPEKLYN